MEKKIPDPIDVAARKTVVVPARVVAGQVAHPGGNPLDTAQNTAKLELRT
jgi:hypothetical protein